MSIYQKQLYLDLSLNKNISLDQRLRTKERLIITERLEKLTARRIVKLLYLFKLLHTEDLMLDYLVSRRMFN